MDSWIRHNPRKSPLSFSRWWHLLVALVLASVSWEIAVQQGILSPIFFPPPSLIGTTLTRLIVNGTLGTNLLASLQRMAMGLLFGGSAGLLLGVAMGWSWRLRTILDPFIAATHNIPKIAVFPLVMLVFGVHEFSKILLLSAGTFFPLLINTMAGVRQISPIHFEVARNYGAGLWKILTRVVLPGSLPSILTGLRIASNTTLMLTLAIELLHAQSGLGVMIWFAWETLRTEELYASLVVIASLGILINLCLQLLSYKLIHWEVEKEI